jgi:hypothetical protein
MMSARKKVSVAQLCCLGKGSNCSEDDMEMTLARKHQQFPRSDAANEDETRSCGLAAASSFTRNGRRQSATKQRKWEREVAHNQRRRQNCKKECDARATCLPTRARAFHDSRHCISRNTHRVLAEVVETLRSREWIGTRSSSHRTAAMELCRLGATTRSYWPRHLFAHPSTPKKHTEMSATDPNRRLGRILIVYKNALRPRTRYYSD